MIKIELNTAHFEEIIKKGFSLDMIFLLKLLDETDEAYSNNPKIGNIIQTMERKGLVVADVVTEEGKAILAFLSSTEDRPKIPRKKKIAINDSFDLWWRTYSGTDSFEYKGRKFRGTRALRVKKEDCRAKLNKILASGEYTIEELIAALKLEINQKMENSVRTGQNKMSYMQNSLTYLNQCTYEPFVELVRAGHKTDEKPVLTGGFDI